MADLDLSAGLVPKASPEAPGVVARASEQFGLTQHPIDQLSSELHQLKEHPVQTLWDTAKTAVVGTRDLAYKAVTHPIDTAKEITGGNRFAEDVQNKNYKGAAGTLLGGGLQAASMALGGKPAPATSVEEAAVRALPKKITTPVRAAEETGVGGYKPITSNDLPRTTAQVAQETANDAAARAGEWVDRYSPLYEDYVKQHPDRVHQIQASLVEKLKDGKPLLPDEAAMAARPKFDPTEPGQVSAWARNWAQRDQHHLELSAQRLRAAAEEKPYQGAVTEILGGAKSLERINTEPLAVGESPSGFTLGAAKPGEDGIAVHDILNREGKHVGTLNTRINGGQAEIRWVGTADHQAPNVDPGELSNQLGHRAISDLGAQYARLHPEADSIAGVRMGGARGAEGRSVSIPLRRAVEEPAPKTLPGTTIEGNLSQADAQNMAAEQTGVRQAAHAVDAVMSKPETVYDGAASVLAGEPAPTAAGAEHTFEHDFLLRGPVEQRAQQILNSVKHDGQLAHLVGKILTPNAFRQLDWRVVQQRLDAGGSQLAQQIGTKLFNDLSNTAERGVAKQFEVHAERAHIHGDIRGVEAIDPAFDPHDPRDAAWGWGKLNPEREGIGLPERDVDIPETVNGIRLSNTEKQDIRARMETREANRALQENFPGQKHSGVIPEPENGPMRERVEREKAMSQLGRDMAGVEKVQRRDLSKTGDARLVKRREVTDAERAKAMSQLGRDMAGVEKVQHRDLLKDVEHVGPKHYIDDPTNARINEIADKYLKDIDKQKPTGVEQVHAQAGTEVGELADSEQARLANEALVQPVKAAELAHLQKLEKAIREGGGSAADIEKTISRVRKASGVFKPGYEPKVTTPKVEWPVPGDTSTGNMTGWEKGAKKVLGDEGSVYKTQVAKARLSLRASVEKAGAEFKGVENNLVYFNDPKTGSTLAVRVGAATPDVIRHKMNLSRGEFQAANAAKAAAQ